MRQLKWLTCPIAMLGAAAAAAPGVPAQPNVLLIIADDMGTDKLGAYADDADPSYRTDALYLPETPVLDSMAEQGVRFTDAWAQPVCSPTRAALQSGRYAFRTGVGDRVAPSAGLPLAEDEVTLAEALAEVGYVSAVFGKWHIGANPYPGLFASGDTWADFVGASFNHTLNPMTQGYDRFIGTIYGTLTTGSPGSTYISWVAVDGEHCEGCDDSVIVEQRTEYATTATVNDTLDWIADQTDPWLAVVALHAPHAPLELPPTGCSYRATGAAVPTDNKGIYEEMVECMDRSIGELLAGIDDLDDTLVIFVGDNGTEARLGEGSFDDSRGKLTVFESGIRVPLIMTDGRKLATLQPGFAWSPDWQLSPRLIIGGGRAVTAPVHVVDLYSTITGIAGADDAAATDSVSLEWGMRGWSPDADRVVISENYDKAGIGIAALRTGDWKITLRVDDDGKGGTCRSNIQLFDLATDRFELSDLSVAEPAVYADMLAILSAEIADESGAWLDVPDC